jgi:starvation-inducible DNA-binding protein
MKRFWKSAQAVEKDGGWGVELDGRPLRTPARELLISPTQRLAEAIAAEWNGVDEEIDPRAMPLSGLANAAIDRVEPDRAAIAGGLSRLLADTYTLYLTTHNFHWNVTGPMFNTLHLMFMEQYTELWNAVDPIAERIRSLGHPAPGSYAQFGRLSSIADVPESPPAALEMVRILVEGHEAVARTARGIFPLAEKAGDEPTADLLTQRLAVHEQTAWMLRSLLEE